jgi:hypothetical protein
MRASHDEQTIFTGPCDYVVDPSIDTVQRLLTQHSSASSNQRVILHYFGYGCHAPTSDGSLFFFTENRSRYFALPVASYIQFCQSPLFLIFDCSSSGSLYKAVLAANIQRSWIYLRYFHARATKLIRFPQTFL